MDRHLIFHGALTPIAARNTQILMVGAFREGATRVVLHICSGGGDVVAGVGLYNFIRSLPWRVDTHAFGPCDSIAATVFMAGAARTCLPISAFVLHGATYSDGPKVGQRAPNTDLIGAPFREILGWSDPQIDHYFGTEDRRLLPREALTLGIVTSVQQFALPMDANAIVHVAMPA
ncbi:MAG: hypothetical protein DI624_09845 [Brevundimonas sp.]|uniref:ATP-dependent Clp protease proteolytic subunit n=1 Tax=Brevundimonas sp. TaxID=1871086 RepID=UPI000DB8944B|nr:ATP-dependent Clp protease proteolytic subunit [Brevundimonas sp.]PZT97570.1 MAG: hypothetical protein DI624_09845 [Brevundimonas sp.]